MSPKNENQKEANEILSGFDNEKNWLPRNFSEKAEIISHETETCIKKIDRHITVEEYNEDLELSESEYQKKTTESRDRYSERDTHTPDNYVEQVDTYIVPGTHETGDCSKCAGKKKVNCSKCDSTGKMKCPDCEGKGEISKKETCKKCEGSGDVESDTCSRCQGEGKEVVTEACTRCGTDGIVTCDRCSGKGIITCPKCNGKGMTHRIKVLNRDYTVHEEVKFENCIAPLELLKDIRGTRVETDTDADSKLKPQSEKWEVKVHKIEYKFPRRLIGSSDKVWELYKIEDSYRCENFPSKLNPLYL